MIRHMVHLRFLPSVSPLQRQTLFDALGALRGHLGGITGFHVTRNISPETAVTHGFDDLFWFDFTDAQARDTYLSDAAHQSVGAGLVAAVGGLDGLFVCDFDL